MQRVFDPESGQWHEFPDDATPEEMTRALSRLAPQPQEQAGPPAPVPEQPGFLARQFQPGGMLSPENVGITGGGMLGATLGAPLGPPGMLAGGLIGAGLGGVLGRGSEMSAPEQRPATVAEALGQLGEASQRGLVSQAVGDIGGALLGKALAPLAHRMTPERQAAAQVAQEVGVPMTAGQLTGSKALGMMENMVPRSPFSVGQAEQFLTTQDTAMKKSLEDFVDAVAPGAARDMQEAGQIASGSLKARFAQARDTAGKLYRAAYAVTNGQKFPLDDYASAVQQVTSEEGPLARLGTGMAPVGQSVMQANTGANNPYGASARVLALLQQTPSTAADVETMHTVRSELLKIVRDSAKRSGFGADPEGRAAAILLNGMDQSMQKVGQVVSQFKPLLDAADKYYAEEVAGTFKNPQVMRALARKAQEGRFDEIVPLVFGPGKSIGPLQSYKKAVGETGFEQSAASWFQDLVTSATDPQTGGFSLQRFLTQMGPRNYSPEFLTEALGSDRTRDLGRLMRVFQAVQEGQLSGANPSQTGRAIIGWSQVMGLLGLTGKIAYQGEVTPGDVEKGAGLLAPNVMGRILFSPTGIRWLSQGLEAQTPQQLTHLATKLATLAAYPSTAEQARLEEERRRRMGQ